MATGADKQPRSPKVTRRREASVGHPNIGHVVVMVQENHTTDHYLSGLATHGVNVATGWPVTPNPPS